MAMILQRILNLSHKIFSKIEKSDLNSNIAKLNELVKKIDVDAIEFDKDILNDNRKYDRRVHRAPIGYVYLWDSPTFSMGVFIIRNGEKIPLHNHPNMHGILKIIHGSAEIKSFSKTINDDDLTLPDSIKCIVESSQTPLVEPVLQHETVIVDSKSDPCILTPSRQNIHEIRATNGTTAFLDILGPPYDDTHTCQYYNLLEQGDISQVNSASGDNAVLKYLIKTAQPNGFFCQALQYTGPAFSDPSEIQENT